MKILPSEGMGKIMKGAIFDVDGTLLDSMTVWYNITNRFFIKHNLILTDEKAALYKEMTLEESLPQINEEFNLGLTNEEIFSEFKEMIADEYKNRVELKPHAKEYLAKLKSEGIKTAVATSGYEGLCKSAFKRLGIIDYIDKYAFSSEVGCNKGQPDVYLLAAQRMGLSPKDCTVFEDIVLGLGSAKKAGFMTCAVFDPTNAAETDALKQLSDHYITGWDELL